MGTISPAQMAFVAGEVWLDARIDKEPTDQDLYSMAEKLSPDCGCLELAKSCVVIAEAVSWVMWARMFGSAPAVATTTALAVVAAPEPPQRHKIVRHTGGGRRR